MLISGGTIRLTRQCSGAFADAAITVAPITERSKLVRPRNSPHASAGFPAYAGGVRSWTCMPPATWLNSPVAPNMVTKNSRISDLRVPGIDCIAPYRRGTGSKAGFEGRIVALCYDQ